MSGVSVNVGGDAKGAINMLNGLAGQAENIAERIRNGFQQRIGQRMFDGLIRAANALPSAMKGAIDAGGRLSDQMARTGAAGEGLVILERVLTNAGMAADSTTRLLGQMQKGLAGINEESQTTGAAFAALNLDMETLRGMDPVTAFNAIGNAIMRIEDPAQRTAIAMRIFGRSGTEALVAFSDTRGMEQARAELGQLPGVLAASAQSLDVVSDRLRNLGTGWQQIGAAAAVAVLPALEKVTAKISSMDLTGLGTQIGRLLNLVVDFAPAIIAVGTAMVGLKIAAILTQLANKTREWWAQTAAINANTAALAKNAVASKAAAAASIPGGGRHMAGAAAPRSGAGASAGMLGRGAMALAGGPIGITLLAAGAAFGVITKKIQEAEAATDARMKVIERSNQAMQKFNLEEIRGTAKSREEIEKTIEAIEDEKRAINEALEAELGRTESKKVRDQLIADTETTIKLLDQRARAVRSTTDAQLEANAATAAARQAELDRAEAVEKAAEAYAKLRENFQKSMDEAGEKADLSGPLKNQLAELDRAEAEIRAKMSSGFGFAGGQAIIDQMDANSDIQGPERTRDLEQAIKLVELEEKRAEIQAKIKQSRADAVADWKEEMSLLTASIAGEDAKVAALEKEAEIRREIARLMDAGFQEDEASQGAEKLVNARLAAEAAREEAEAEERRNEARSRGQDIALDALAAAQGEAAAIERAIQKRAAELAKESGLDRAEAEDIARNEADLERLTRLRGQADGMQFQSTLGAVSDMQRIGGGGGVVSSGIDIARQQADLQRQMVQLLSGILARSPETTISDF